MISKSLRSETFTIQFGTIHAMMDTVLVKIDDVEETEDTLQDQNKISHTNKCQTALC